MKRGTEDLDFFIGDEALAAASGPGRHHSTISLKIY
jgi:actin-related protein 3